MSKGSGWMIAGIVMLAGAIGLCAYNVILSESAGERTEESVAVLSEKIKTASQGSNSVTAAEQPEEDPIPQWISDPATPMKEIDIDGVDYVGYLEIPSLELCLPVISEWSDSMLQIAPCRYAGSVYLGNMVIAAHNYPAHFGRIKELSSGDSVIFTDSNNTHFAYMVDTIEVLPPDAVEEVIAGEWPLTLFTCTVGGAERVVLRCEASS